MKEDNKHSDVQIVLKINETNYSCMTDDEELWLSLGTQVVILYLYMMGKKLFLYYKYILHYITHRVMHSLDRTDKTYYIMITKEMIVNFKPLIFGKYFNN